MDSLDIRILRLVLQGNAFSPLNPYFRTSCADIAKKIGADEDTVRNRLKKLHSGGLLGDWWLIVNPQVWGGGQVVALVDSAPDAPKDDVVEKLMLVPGVVIINCYYEHLGLVMNFEDEASIPRQVELVRRLSGSPSVRLGKVPLPPCKTKPTAREWDLIRALRRDPRMPQSELAKETGLSQRTIHRRLPRIVQEGFAFTWPTINPRAANGKILAMLSVLCPWDRMNDVDEAVQARLEPHLWHVMHMLPYGPREMQPTGYDLAVSNIGEAREVLEWVRSVPGVRTANIDLYENIYSDFRSYDQYLDRKLKEMPTARSK